MDILCVCASTLVVLSSTQPSCRHQSFLKHEWDLLRCRIDIRPRSLCAQLVPSDEFYVSCLPYIGPSGCCPCLASCAVAPAGVELRNLPLHDMDSAFVPQLWRQLNSLASECGGLRARLVRYLYVCIPIS